MMRTVFCLLATLVLCICVNAQNDSSSVYSHELSGGRLKEWYTRPIIINTPRQIPVTTLTFKTNPATGTLQKSGSGRDITKSFRNFKSWKVEKQNDEYFLVISQDEKYLLTLKVSAEGTRILILDADEANKKHRSSLKGKFFETPLKIN